MSIAALSTPTGKAALIGSGSQPLNQSFKEKTVVGSTMGDYYIEVVGEANIVEGFAALDVLHTYSFSRVGDTCTIIGQFDGFTTTDSTTNTGIFINLTGAGLKKAGSPLSDDNLVSYAAVYTNGTAPRALYSTDVTYPNRVLIEFTPNTDTAARKLSYTLSYKF